MAQLPPECRKVLVAEVGATAGALRRLHHDGQAGSRLGRATLVPIWQATPVPPSPQ